MKKADVEEFYRRLQEQNPEPKGELDWVNPFTLLVAVVLSAQATDVGVNKATGPLFKVADTPEKMVALGEATIRDYVKTIGLYRNKAKNVFALSQILIDQHGSVVPDDQAALEALPGVGRKTANVVRNIAFGAPTIAVDTHIFRIGNRTGLAPGNKFLFGHTIGQMDVASTLFRDCGFPGVSPSTRGIVMADENPCFRRQGKNFLNGAIQLGRVTSREIGARCTAIGHKQRVADKGGILNKMCHARRRMAGCVHGARAKAADIIMLVGGKQMIKLTTITLKPRACIEYFSKYLLHCGNFFRNADFSA